MFKEGQLVCRTNIVLADDRDEFLNFGFQAVRLEDALDQNEDGPLFDIEEDFIGMFLKYDPHYKKYSHVLYGEEILLVRTSYLMLHANHALQAGKSC